MNFATPLAFLLFIPIAFAAWRMLRRSKRPRAIPFAPMRFMPRNKSGWRGLLATAIPYFFLAAIVLLVISAARPQTRFSKETRSVDAIAIAMVVDVSGSMQALDLAKNPNAADAPNRLDVVKEEFAAFISERPNDLITLITFGGFASTRCPLTADHGTVMQYLAAVNIPGLAAEDEGRQVSNEETLTAVGDGLTTACARLKDSELKSKIVVLLSDGVSNTGIVTPAEAAKIAKELGIKVYTIGVGSNSGRAPFRARDFFGRTTIAYGQVEFDEAELRNIAETTGGQYYNVRSRDKFTDVMEEIDRLETTAVESEVYYNYDEHFHIPLICGAVLAIAASFLSILLIHKPV